MKLLYKNFFEIQVYNQQYRDFNKAPNLNSTTYLLIKLNILKVSDIWVLELRKRYKNNIEITDAINEKCLNTKTR